MKKYLILLIIPLLFFSTGCEEDELVSVQETQLDPNLFGVWNMEYGNSIVTHSFSNNGKKMFIFQAAKAFKIWHGIDLEIDKETLGLLEK